MEPSLPALGALSLSHWPSREVADVGFQGFSGCIADYRAEAGQRDQSGGSGPKPGSCAGDLDMGRS